MDRVAVPAARRKVLVAVAVAVADYLDRMEALLGAIDLTMLGLQKGRMEVAAVVRRTLSSSSDIALHYRTIHWACSAVAEARNRLFLLAY